MQQYYYPTASTVAVFVNGLHVDQAYRIDYKDNIPKTPLYGYNEYEFNQITRGKGYVQGMLIINFTVPFYLSTVLAGKTTPFIPRLYNSKTSDSSTDQALDASIKQSILIDLPPNSTTDSRNARAEYIAGLLSKKDPQLKEKIKSSLYDTFTDNKNTTVKNPTEYQKDINNPLVYPLDSNVTLDVYYTDPKDSAWFIRFNDVHFYDVTQQISQAGAEGSSEPLYEIYSFLAKNKTIQLIS